MSSTKKDKTTTVDFLVKAAAFWCKTSPLRLENLGCTFWVLFRGLKVVWGYSTTVRGGPILNLRR